MASAIKSLALFILRGFIGEKSTMDFYDRVADVYESAMSGQQQHAREIISWLPKGDIGLDLGCGTGISTLELMAKSDFTVGIDFSRGMLKEAQKKGLERLVNGNIAELPFRDNSINCATAIGVLRHLPYGIEQPFFNEVYRVLKQNGMFMVPAAKYTFLNRIILGVYNKFMKVLGYDEQLARFDIGNLKSLGKNAGFAVQICPFKGLRDGFLVYFIKDTNLQVKLH